MHIVFYPPPPSDSWTMDHINDRNQMLWLFCYRVSQRWLALRPLIKSKGGKKKFFNALFLFGYRWMSFLHSYCCCVVTPTSAALASVPLSSTEPATVAACIPSFVRIERRGFVAGIARICLDSRCEEATPWHLWLQSNQSHSAGWRKQGFIVPPSRRRNGVGCRLTRFPNAGHFAALPSWKSRLLSLFIFTGRRREQQISFSVRDINTNSAQAW